MSTENNKTPEQQEKVPAKIMLEPIEFDGQAKCMYTNTAKLADLIGSVFGPVFEHYSGCKIVVNNGIGTGVNVVTQSFAPGSLYVDLYFKENGISGDGIPNLIHRATINKGSSDLMQRMGFVMGGNANRVYNVTEETKEVLLDFLPGANRPGGVKNPRWNERIQELAVRTDPYGNSRQEVVVRITGLDLGLILSKIYGSTVEVEGGKKTRYDYSIVPLRQVIGTSDEYVVQITQLDQVVIDDMAKAIGGYNFSYGYNIYRG